MVFFSFEHNILCVRGDYNIIIIINNNKVAFANLRTVSCSLYIYIIFDLRLIYYIYIYGIRRSSARVANASIKR